MKMTKKIRKGMAVGLSVLILGWVCATFCSCEKHEDDHDHDHDYAHIARGECFLFNFN